MESRLPGLLYDLGDYPGVLLGPGGWVSGEIYAIEPELETVLDQIEGISPDARDEYFKQTVEIKSNGESYACLVYEVNAQRLAGKELITHGDWVRHRKQTKV